MAGGLVAKQQPRLLGQRSGDRDPLRLAAGKLTGKLVESLREPDELEQLLGPERRTALSVCHVLGEGDVLERGEVRKEVRALKHVART